MRPGSFEQRYERVSVSLELAVEFVNGDARKDGDWKPTDVTAIAEEFLAYLRAKTKESE